MQEVSLFRLCNCLIIRRGAGLQDILSFLLGKGVSHDLMVECQVLGIPCPPEEVDNPLLLLRIQQALPIMVAVVVTMSSQILLESGT